MTSQVCAMLVGLVFLGTGALKALDSSGFLSHVRRYRLLPRTVAPAAAILFIGFECALGAALVLDVSPWLLSTATVVLVLFAILTAWATSSGRVEDCGCYGGLLFLTPTQSFALDGFYLVLLVVAWVTHPSVPQASAPWQVLSVAAVLAAAVGAALRSQRTPLVDLALLRVGRGWRKRWLKDYARDVTSGSHFVVFLSRDCPYCKRWVPLLNVVEVQPDLPSVVGVMSLEGAPLREFLSEHVIRFPITYMPQSLVSLMVNAYPTAALIENGTVVEKWVGEMPQAYIERIRQFFDAIAPQKKSTASFGG
jgi:uncharacterized membrane protein YphA (DoxX/SURF4 family)